MSELIAKMEKSEFGPKFAIFAIFAIITYLVYTS